MDWLLSNPQIHSTFASLGQIQGDAYVMNEGCLKILEEINYKLSIEDHTLRTFRRAIGFAQNVKTDIIPLLINAKDPKIIDGVITLLVNLTVPIECLLPVDAMIRTEVGRHTIHELNMLLVSSKECFVDSRATKAILDYMKSILESDTKLSNHQCTSIGDCLLLLRNVLHIPEINHMTMQNGLMAAHPNHTQTTLQNQIIWNLFTQSIDKLIIHLMTSPQKSYWAVTIVQFIALIYKDQNVGTLQKLLNLWFEASLSDSSEDNESNTTPPKQCSGDSSPMLTSDPTSDSSDNGSRKTNDTNTDQNVNEHQHNYNAPWRTNMEFQSPALHRPLPMQNSSSKPQQTKPAESSMGPTISHSPKPTETTESVLTEDSTSMTPEITKSTSNTSKSSKTKHRSGTNSSSSSSGIGTSAGSQSSSGFSQGKNLNKSQQSISQDSDCGYATQVENNQESISTSSNDDEQNPPVHQKPPIHNQKQRYNAALKQRNANSVSIQDKKEWRRKKLVKRSRCTIINMKGLIHHTPTDEDISNILKEFTVDFLLKGYGYLVQELHLQLLSELPNEKVIDTSHFFWLVTYFLKFAAQLELDFEHISYVLSFDIVSYLTFEGVSLCEQLELTTRQGGDIKPCLRRMHLVVTAIREVMQAVEVFKKSTHLSTEDNEQLSLLQLQMSTTEDLRSLFVLLIRCYNPKIQSRQYLQDLVVTNHQMLLLMDCFSKMPEHAGNIKIMEHIQQFSTVDIIRKYGLLLEDFESNGEYVNNTIFTLLHHIGGDLGQPSILFQPSILKTFSKIWETEYEVCDDWSDLIEYIIHKFMNTSKLIPLPNLSCQAVNETSSQIADGYINGVWAKEEIDTLYWFYVQSKKSEDTVEHIIKQYHDSMHVIKCRIDVIQQLMNQDIITLVEFDELMRFEDSKYQRAVKGELPNQSSIDDSGCDVCDRTNLTSEKAVDDYEILRDRLLEENKGDSLAWLQKVLLECCFIKLTLSNPKSEWPSPDDVFKSNVKTMEPIPRHCILKRQSIPLVPYNTEQNKMLVYQPFVLLLHKLGFHLSPNKFFVRIPGTWTADMLFSVAEKLGTVEQSNLKFDINQIHRSSLENIPKMNSDIIQNIYPVPIEELLCAPESSFAISRSKITNSIIGFTPDPAPNWLQLVMKSKATTSERSLIDPLPTANANHFVSIFTTPLTKNTFSNVAPLSPKSVISTASTDLQMILELDNDSLSVIMKSDNSEIGEENAVEALEEEHDVASETCSVASDLTRMYVSDEEDKHDLIPTLL